MNRIIYCQQCRARLEIFLPILLAYFTYADDKFAKKKLLKKILIIMQKNNFKHIGKSFAAMKRQLLHKEKNAFFTTSQYQSYILFKNLSTMVLLGFH